MQNQTIIEKAESALRKIELGTRHGVLGSALPQLPHVGT